MESPKLNLPAGFGINLISYFGGDFGVGNSARAFAAALRERGVPLAIANIANGQGFSDTNDEWSACYTQISELPYPVNLYILFADFSRVLAAHPHLLNPGRMHVSMLWYETTTLPMELASLLLRLDALVACTPFISVLAANHLPLLPIINARHPVSIPQNIMPNRALFGIPEQTFCFCSSFNPSSNPDRKNPLAPIRAFQSAFSPDDDSVRLFIRIHHADVSELARQTTASLVHAAGNDRRIELLTGPMSYEEILTLYASCDAYVSLHRAEGLGLGLLEAMHLGKPVIATAWSGNMDFMDFRCACPVRYRLTPATGVYDIKNPCIPGETAIWAEPVLEDAVTWYRTLRSSPDIRTRIGEAARAKAAEYQDEALACDWISELAILWQAQQFLPPIDGKFSKAAIAKDVSPHGKPSSAFKPRQIDTRTLVIQSFRTHDVPPWLNLCMKSVKDWAGSRGWTYRLMDDRFFDFASIEIRRKCGPNLYALTDICRLRWILQELDQGWERVVWADADILVFAPDLLDISTKSGHGFAHEVFLPVRNDGEYGVIEGCNNALMVFESRGRPIVQQYLDATLEQLDEFVPGQVPRTALGPDMLKHWYARQQLELIGGVGLFTMEIMNQIASGSGPLPGECVRLSRGPLAAANLCHFLRNAAAPEHRRRFDALYLRVTEKLLQNRGLTNS